MNTPTLLSQIPENIREAPWLKQILNLIQQQIERIAVLEKTVQELKDENARLKKIPKRPKFRPGGGNPNARSGNGHTHTGSGPANKMAPQKIQQEVRITATAVPEGSRFKGYQHYAVQELEITPKDITYKLEVWQAPNGSIIRAALPPEIEGSHFGHQLRALVHNLYALGMTEPGLFDLLRGSGIEISEGQVHHLLMSETEKYHQASEVILTAGLQEAAYLRTDDTGAKHQHKNGYCTHIGGQYFAYYKTTLSKSRANFLSILLQGKEGYTINQAFLWHLFQSGIEDDLLNRLEEHLGKTYRTKKGINRLLNKLGLVDKKQHLQCLEAGLVGFISETILKPNQILLSDRAGQFAVFDHAACWVHMERPLRKLQAATDEIEQEIKRAREAIWILYDKLKEASFTQTGKEEVHHLYDQLIDMRSLSPGVNEVIASFAHYREELLKALDHPGLPLHNNDSERDIRSMVKRREISGSTKSEQGKTFRDSLMTLKQTCFRLGLSFWGYLMGHFKGQPLDLAQVVRERYQSLALDPSG